jgi:hypothetical protein
MPAKGGEGVILVTGGASAGYALYVQNGKLVYHYNRFDRERTNLLSNIPLQTGKSTVTMEFAYDGGGIGKGGEAGSTAKKSTARGSSTRLRDALGSTRSAWDQIPAPRSQTRTRRRSHSPERLSESTFWFDRAT